MISKSVRCGSTEIDVVQSGYTLCKAAIKNSQWVWTQLRKSRKYQSKIGEESLTDFFVLNFKQWRPDGFIIKTFTRQDEALNGSDWEWWFGSGGGWVGMRVQAKVIDIETSQYKHLHYKRKDGTYQVNALISKAETNHLLPIYCLYTYWDNNSHVRLKTASGKPMLRRLEFGASLLSAHIVQSGSKNNDLSSLLLDMVPLCKLFCHKSPLRKTFVSKILRNAEENGLLKNGYLTPTNLIKKSPPKYVINLLQYDENMFPVLEISNDTTLRRVTVVFHSNEAP